MSKGNKEEQKWLLGESLNQYDRSLKEELGKVEKRNREQNHKISALINAFDDDYIKKEEENTNISLDYSKEGIVIVDDIKGNTLVNNVKDSNKELVLNGDIDTQGVNVTLEDTVDNGKVDVVLEGNTEVNLSKTKDPIMITHKFDDINSNNGKLQTTVNGVTTVNDSPGKVDVKEITGDTLVNHVSNGSEELILNGDIDTNGYSNVTLTEGIDGGKVDVSLEGNTMVNVCDQEEPVAITKSYTVETGNHIALQGEYDGKCRPNIYGNTLVNLMTKYKDERLIEYFYPVQNEDVANVEMLKPNTEYTLIYTARYQKTGDDGCLRIHLTSSKDDALSTDQELTTSYTQYIYKFTTPSNVSNFVLRANSSYFYIKECILLEGDYTNKPIPDYFTGMKSSFEDKLVPENLASDVVKNGKINKQYTDLSTVSSSKLKRNTKYTTFIKNDGDEDIQVYSNDTSGNFIFTKFTIPAKSSKVVTISTKDTELDSTKKIWLSLFVTETLPQNVSAYLVEGDYTNYDFTNYDSTKVGKYKVDYKVTGKNKCNGHKLYPKYINTDSGKIVDGTGNVVDFIRVKPNTKYITSIKGESRATNVYYYDINKEYIGKDPKVLPIFTTPSNCYYTRHFYGVNGEEEVIQLEEGTTATTYEPYKESIKTLYLNSPLLEGDTIEQSGNNIIHNHRYGSVVFDGSEDENWIYDNVNLDAKNNFSAYYPNGNIGTQIVSSYASYITLSNSILCDKFYEIMYDYGTGSRGDMSGIATINTRILLSIPKSKLSTQDLVGFQQYLQQNPITVVYKLKIPTQEIISTNDNLLLDSYTNGHLDVDTVVPIDKVEFRHKGFENKYLNPNVDYIVQFEADNVGKIDYIILGGEHKLNINVTKGINKILCTSGEIENWLDIVGIGFNMSKVVVTPKVDNDFGYFKGMKSVGECEGNKIEILSRNKNILPIEELKKYIGNGLISEGLTINVVNDKIIINGTSNTVWDFRPINISWTPKFFKFINSLPIGTSIRLNNNLGFNNYWAVTRNGKVNYLGNTITIQQEDSNINGFVRIPQGYSFENNQELQLQIEFGTNVTNYVTPKIDKKEILLNEPLRGLPNGVKDKYVIIDGKWYIERNCIEFIVNETNLKSNFYTEQGKDLKGLIVGAPTNKHRNNNNSICDRFTKSIGTFDENGIGYFYENPVNFMFMFDMNTTLIDAKNKLIGAKFLCQSQTPTYEPIDYNPFEVYTDTTHISNNSNIPCNMVIKNSGYNTISLKENTKYTAYVNNKNNVSLTYKIDNNAIAVNSSNKFTFTTPSTLVDKTIRIASKGNKIENLMIIEGTPQNNPIGYFDGLKSSYECEKVTDVNDENFGKYKVDARVVGENFESTQTVYLNSPLLKGDKIIWKDNKLQHYHKMKTIVFDGSDDEGWKRQENIDTNNTQRYYIPNTTVKINSLLINNVFPTALAGERDDLTHLYVHNELKRFDIKKLKTDTRWNDVNSLKKYLQQNPITVVYELVTPYYEEISEYPLKFSSIANCSLSTTSNIQVSNISFNIYEETLPYLYNDKKYYITFNSDISKEIIINLGGSELTYTTKVGFNKVEITTPSNSNNMLTFNGQGVNINNVKVTQQNIDSYFEGMKSVGECEVLEIVSNNNDNTLSNKQTMTHKPLRGLPNGVKDKYVIIDGKWYIERNCKIINTKDLSWTDVGTNNSFSHGKRYIFAELKTGLSNTRIIGVDCANYKPIAYDNYDYDGECVYISNSKVYLYIGCTLNEFLNKNIEFIIISPSPTYEPIDYNPFEVYTDTTHISNNSLIPCNMVVKNTGYNCILKPNTKYTVVTNTQNSISAKIGSTKVDSTSNIFTIVTPSTLTDSILRFSGKGLTTKDIMLLEGDKTNYTPKYFTGMESAFEQEYDEEKNKYKVNVKVTDGNKENNITFYINEPLRGVGDIKDKVYVKEDKVVVERNCASVTFDGSESWLIDNSSSKYIEFNNKIITRYSPLKCNLYLWQLYGETERICCTIYGIYIKINKAKLQTQDVAGFKQWLQQNPVIVVYRLATPVYEEVECDLSKLMLENYENSSLILNSNIPPTVDVRYKGEVPIVSATKELSSNVESTTTDINENIIPYMCDMDYRIVELQLKNASTQGLEVNVLGLDSEDVLFNNRKANKIFNPSYEMLKRDILSKRYSTDEYKYRLERYLLANKISNEEYNELEELINNGR